LPAAVAATIAGVGAWALVEPWLVAVRGRTVRLPGWPRSLDGLTVALIADLHAGAPQVDAAAVARLVARTNRRAPDLVTLLGDHVDGHHRLGSDVSPDEVAGALGGLRARRGVVAVLGNHDWATDGPGTARALRAAGIVVLENDAVRAGEGLWVAGVGDATTRAADVERALAGAPGDAPVLLLTHDPDVFPRVPARVALTLAGHTHGAQVDIPLLRRRWIPSRFGARYAGGHIEEGGRHMVVSAGVGTSGWPVRLGARPEVLLLRLRCAGRRAPRRASA
jgi:predicted MPP superfamily phosphohydrolase